LAAALSSSRRLIRDPVDKASQAITRPRERQRIGCVFASFGSVSAKRSGPSPIPVARLR
jgi:hypothetical protein